MSKKVVITQEQADAIERWSDKEQLIIAKVVGLLEHGLDEPIYTLTTKELIQALYIGYEVEPEFKVGDWVVCEAPKGAPTNVYKVTENTGYSVNLDNIYGNFKKNTIRHATPSEIAEEKERRFWRKHGRAVWELKVGDVLHHEGYKKLFEVEHTNKTRNVWFKQTGYIYTHYEVRNHFKVVAFAENRLDVKENE